MNKKNIAKKRAKRITKTNYIHTKEFTDDLMRGIMFPPYILIKRMSEEDIKKYIGGRRTGNKVKTPERPKQHPNLRRSVQRSTLRERNSPQCTCVRGKVSRQVEANNKVNQRNYAMHDDGKMFCAYVQLAELSQRDIKKLTEKKN